MFGSIAGVVSEFVLGITDPLYYSDIRFPEMYVVRLLA
jgi:hypothetical protein